MLRLPGVEWVADVETDPIRALELFVLGWFPAEQQPEAGEDTSGTDELDDMSAALAVVHRLARSRPALYAFHDPLWRRLRRVKQAANPYRARS
ncbi:hypothetical protein [Embleya sp. AB8]|uniref:hypothetical protein n=1 Tax=Embleya sp. AB8 TaxID=3156304 RepID=UPI003C726BA6